MGIVVMDRIARPFRPVRKLGVNPMRRHLRIPFSRLVPPVVTALQDESSPVVDQFPPGEGLVMPLIQVLVGMRQLIPPGPGLPDGFVRIDQAVIHRQAQDGADETFPQRSRLRLVGGIPERVDEVAPAGQDGTPFLIAGSGAAEASRVNIGGGEDAIHSSRIQTRVGRIDLHPFLFRKGDPFGDSESIPPASREGAGRGSGERRQRKCLQAVPAIECRQLGVHTFSLRHVTSVAMS